MFELLCCFYCSKQACLSSCDPSTVCGALSMGQCSTWSSCCCWRAIPRPYSPTPVSICIPFTFIGHVRKWPRPRTFHRTIKLPVIFQAWFLFLTQHWTSQTSDHSRLEWMRGWVTSVIFHLVPHLPINKVHIDFHNKSLSEMHEFLQQ